MSYNQNSGFGQALLNMVASQVPTFGRIFVVMDPDDTDEENYQRMQEVIDVDPNGQLRFFTSLESAYAATESNNNDVILLDANSTHEIAAMLTVAKNRVHFIGMDGGERLTQQGAKLNLATAATDAAATVTVTGTRCSFRNIKFQNSGTHTNSVSCVIGAGEGTLYKNCTFQKLSDLGETGVSDYECRDDSATFLDCEFGFDTLAQTAARPTLRIKASGSTLMKNCKFRGCTFVAASTSADKVHVTLENTSSIAFYNTMEDCNFINSIVSSMSAIAATVAVASYASSVQGSLHFINPMTNAASFSTTSDQWTIYGSETAAAATTGLAVTPS